MAEIASPRKGTELTPRVFGTWQEQVNRALRALAVEFRATLELNFTSVGGHAQKEQAGLSVPGARVGANVLVTPTLGPLAGLAFDGFVTADDTVTVRAINFTAGAINPPARDYEVLVWNR